VNGGNFSGLLPMQAEARTLTHLHNVRNEFASACVSPDEEANTNPCSHLCWPLALLALLLYPLLWLVLLPFRLVGIAVDGVLELIRGIILLPARILKGPRRA